MKQLYLDCQSGISGDMTLTALIDLGADIDYIKNQLRQLPIDSFSMDIKQTDKKGISSKELVLDFPDEHEHVRAAEAGHVHSHHHHNHSHTHSDDHTHHHAHRKASTILNMIKESELPSRVKERSRSVFEMIAQAEGKIHGMDPAEVHFHEVGAMDSIIDVIGVCLALENLEIDRIMASPVPTGYGKLRMAHGLYPIPAPATAEILRGIPLADFQVEGELTTPTGAGFVKALALEYGQMPALPMERIGYGAGKKDFEHPNVLRAILFQANDKPESETITVLECQLDDMSGEALGYLMEKAFDKGALDVYFTPITMKKSRPATLITILTKPENVLVFEELLLRETSTFGVRKSQWERSVLHRRFQTIETAYGKMTVKIGYKDDDIYKITPEYEEAKVVAAENNIPLNEVYGNVRKAAKEQICSSD
ncbi:nickel pincer cofactor biosynthesis protein LarC [Salibacterium salarium]|uniref:Pyridinium-3,5-bisthiocarboxylic acid mononucleotide nickel insertion protein n=1 Tax=Salibacterium salarium TaxID=284579 RepID=A0A3R9QLK4_9BACI|nr:nickel pincer cofactor biosynthesis protein LarC [Salibacterium salarium]RSL33504.1 nickel pincer cofactor biosynthesis protein LarC [Salibacterium salarium]